MGADTQIIPLEKSSFNTTSAVTFIALDTDANGAFDRAGVPNSDVITLYPAGVVFGFTEEPLTIHISCNYPAQTPISVHNAFTLALPAGDCLFRSINDGIEQRNVVSVTANDFTEIILLREKEQGGIALTAFTILICAGIATTFILRKKKRVTPSSEVLRVLKAEERAIVEYLCSRGPQLAGVVRKDLAIPKTTFHRTLTRLREKNLVVEEEYGNTTKLRWNESFHRK
jgi:uncharacterized membrane protein